MPPLDFSSQAEPADLSGATTPTVAQSGAMDFSDQAEPVADAYPVGGDAGSGAGGDPVGLMRNMLNGAIAGYGETAASAKNLNDLLADVSAGRRQRSDPEVIGAVMNWFGGMGPGEGLARSATVRPHIEVPPSAEERAPASGTASAPDFSPDAEPVAASEAAPAETAATSSAAADEGAKINTAAPDFSAQAEIVPPSPDSVVNLPRGVLDQIADEQSLSDREKLVRALGGESAADDFTKLDRRRNSPDPNVADAASEQFDRKYGNLTPDQERLIYGVGETGLSREDLRAVQAAHSDTTFGDVDSDTDVAYVLSVGARKLNPTKIAEVMDGGGTGLEQANFIRVRDAYAELSKRGLSGPQIEQTVLDAFERAGWSRAHAAEVMSAFGRSSERPAAAAPGLVALPDFSSAAEPVTGAFGPIYGDLAGDWGATVDRLKTEQTGEVPGALYHPEIGPIDVPWGDARAGLAHIVAQHPDVVADLPALIPEMTVRSRSPNRVVLDSPDHRAVVSLQYDNEAKTWLLTAYRKEEGGSGASAGGISPNSATLTERTNSSIREGAEPHDNMASDGGGGNNVPPGAELPEAPPPIPPELTEPRLQQGHSKSVVDAAADLLTEGRVTRDPSLLLSDQIAELLQTDRLNVPQIKAILDKHGVSLEQFSADLWRTNVRKAAQDLQTLSALSQRLGDLAAERGAAADLAGMGGGINPASRAMGFWRRLDNVRRGLMVTQISTAMRNLEGQVGRLGIDVLEQGLDSGLRRIFGEAGLSRNETAAPDAMGALMRFFQPLKTKRAVDQVLSRFPKAHDRLFGSVMSDVAVKSGPMRLLGKAEVGVRVLNVANTFQEYAFRRAVFAATLDRELARRGLNLEDMIAKNRMGAIPRDVLDGAVKHALELTFAKNFSPFAAGAEGMAGKFISFVTGTPLSLVLPFPRFLMNSVKFLYDYSPAAFLKLLSPAERAKIAAGDMTAISRATIGTAMLFGAYQLRNSQYAGERWYEIRTSGGRTVDMRPFAPFSAYLFIADLAKRAKDGTLNRLTTQDIASGLLSTNVRAGAGLYAVDTIINGLVAKGSPEKALRAVQDFAGEVAASFLTPLGMVSDLFAQFDKEAQKVRTGREGPYIGFGSGPGGLPAIGINAGPMMREIPGLDQRLPQVQQPTRSEGMVKEAPLLKALTGIALNSPKNGLERELDRLGFTGNEIVQSTGEPEADRLIAQRMGPISEKALVPLTQSPRYQALSDPVKAEVLSLAVAGVRRAAIETARADEPLLFARIKLLDMPLRQRLAVEEALGRSIDSLIPRKR